MPAVSVSKIHNPYHVVGGRSDYGLIVTHSVNGQSESIIARVEVRHAGLQTLAGRTLYSGGGDIIAESKKDQGRIVAKITLVLQAIRLIVELLR